MEGWLQPCFLTTLPLYSRLQVLLIFKMLLDSAETPRRTCMQRQGVRGSFQEYLTDTKQGLPGSSGLESRV